MAKLRHNIIANFISQGWLALVGVVFSPIYIRMLGMEAYGLVGIYLSMQGLLFVLDLGLSAALTRELARSTNAENPHRAAHDVFHTIERLFLPLCALITLLSLMASGLIAEYWLRPASMDDAHVARAMLLICLAITAQWPAAFYAGGLVGLERQVPLGMTNVLFTTLRWAMVIPVMWWANSSIEVFLGWQIGVSAVQSLVMRRMLIRELPPSNHQPRFDRELVFALKGFALGLFGIAVLSFTLVQADRIVLSHVLPLDAFGKYVLAATAAGLLSRGLYPFFIALYPRFSGLVARNDQQRLLRLYRVGNGMVAALGGAVAAIICVFPADILRLWTGDAALAGETAPVLAILAAGMLLNGLMSLSYALQLAHGWTRLSLWLNAASVIAMIPVTFWMARHHGMMGAASCWLALNLFNFLFVVPYIHARLLPPVMLVWFRDVLLPVFAAFAVAFAAHLLVQVPEDFLPGCLVLAAISLSSLGASILVCMAIQGLSPASMVKTINA